MKIYLALLTAIACTVANVLEDDLDILAKEILGDLASKVFDRFRFNKTSDVPDICLSPKCLRTATEILIKMNAKIEPCDDFYQFACGNYIDKAQIPANKGIMTEYISVAAKVEEQLKSIIKEERPKTDPKYLKLPNTLYKACMNTTLIETLGSQPMQDLATALGGWPVIVGQSWDSNNSWTWQETVMKFRELGFPTNYIINVSINVDLYNSSKYIITLDKPALSLKHEHWLNESIVSHYYDYMIDLAVLFGADNETAMKELIESLQFERELDYISQTNGTSKKNLRTIKQLLEAYPYIQWLDYINGLLPEGLSYDENEIINLATPSFFYELKNLLKLSHKRTLANYMMWRIHESSVPFLSEKFQKRKLKYATDLLGNQSEEPRSKYCDEIASDSNDTKEIIWDMIDNIGGTFIQVLDEVNWMDDMTKQLAKQKFHTLTAHVGYNDELLDNENLEKLYRNLDIDGNKYFESILKMNVFDTDYSFNKLKWSVNYVNWFRKALPMGTNTYYSPFYNDILFPAGILQGNFFNIERPMYLNYGAIGSIIGHEFAHSFPYDDKSNLIDWMKPETQRAYLDRTKCIIQQYSNYIDQQTGLSLNGIITQDENIADNIGIRQAYLGYRKWITAYTYEKEPMLPGLDYTPQQMFWISAAQRQCAKYKTNNFNSSINHYIYPPHELRVLGPLSNIQEFSSDFQCPVGSVMNPVKKCQIW